MYEPKHQQNVHQHCSTPALPTRKNAHNNANTHAHTASGSYYTMFKSGTLGAELIKQARKQAQSGTKAQKKRQIPPTSEALADSKEPQILLSPMHTLRTRATSAHTPNNQTSTGECA